MGICCMTQVNKLICIYFFLTVLVFVAVLAFSTGARPSLCRGFFCCRPQARGARALVAVACGLSSWGSQAHAQYLCDTDLVVLPNVGSSWTRNKTHVSCTGRWVLYHSATREGQTKRNLFFFIVLEPGGLRSMCLWGWLLASLLFLGCRRHHWLCPHPAS